MLGNVNNAYSQGLAGQTAYAGNEAAPRTLASAASRIESVNERLDKVTDALLMVCSQIGAMTAMNQLGGRDPSQTSASGAVHRLNDAADEAHTKILMLETYIASIQRALG